MRPAWKAVARTRKPPHSRNPCRLGSGTSGLPAPGPYGVHAFGVNPKKIFAEGRAQCSGPGSSNKRIRSWLRTIYPYSLGIILPQQVACLRREIGGAS
jgi:hypothetical protein